MSKAKKFDFNDNFKNMFSATTLNSNIPNSTSNGLINIATNKLVPFQNHPFKLYEGERFSDMVASIKENGIIMPIIVRPFDGETYEILSGHNRIEAAKVLGIESVSAIVREDLNDDEALLIVTETNLIQRSFTDLAHSERATALAVRHEAIKNQGKRTDLINEMEYLLKSNANPSNNGDSETCSLIGNKLKTIEKVGQQYGLSKNSVARYLRVNKLNKELKERVDNDEIPIYAAVEISYMSEQEQADLANLLSKNPEFKIDIKKAALLRENSEKNILDMDSINSILSGQFMEIKSKKRNRSSLPVQSIKIGGKVLSKYFEPGQNPEEIEAEIIEALEFYRANKKEI